MYLFINQQKVASKIVQQKRRENGVIEILTLLILIQKYLSESNTVDKAKYFRLIKSCSADKLTKVCFNDEINDLNVPCEISTDIQKQ